MTKTKTNIQTIYDCNDTPFTISGGKLTQGVSHGPGRQINLTTLGKILRGYKTTKFRAYNDQKCIGVSLKGGGFIYAVKVSPGGLKSLSIGCVEFLDRNAATLRRAALKSSKVTA